MAAISRPETVELNLKVTDPLAERLYDGGWRGIGGPYRLRLRAPTLTHCYC